MTDVAGLPLHAQTALGETRWTSLIATGGRCARNTRLPPADVPYYRHRGNMPLYPPGDGCNCV